jgi:lauroyl/myristoyl acyltransferase
VIRPAATERELRRIARLTYRSYARDTLDFIRALSMTRATLEPLVAAFEGDHFDELFAEGRGMILAGGHFGNWELGGVILRLLRGYRLAVVGRPEPSVAVNQLRLRMRESLSIETIEIGRVLETALQIRRELSNNGIVAMLLDRHVGRDQVEVEFFGRRAAFIKTPAMIAYMAGAPLVPSFIIRQPDRRFAAICGAPIRPDMSLSPDESARRMTQAFAAELEQRIREHPHLWYQFYPYWNQQQPASG